MTSLNPSTAQAAVMADEFHRQRVDFAVISPGSRSAALAIAFDQHPGIETRMVLDERSAAFHALGRARAGGRPVVAICTSGTAVANFLPAVVEADLSLVPIILLSADRPSDLMHVGANQTIDQSRIFGDRARWFCDVPPADPSRDENAYWRTTVSQAVARALGHGSRPGPVHVNVAFREPTVPVLDDGRSVADPYPYPTEGRGSGAAWQEHFRSSPGAGALLVDPGARGLVVVGEGDFDRSALSDAVARLRWPLLATAASGLRGSDVITTYHHLLVEQVPRALQPDIVVTVGRVGPSDRIGRLTELDVPQIQIDLWGAWNDPRRHATHLLQSDPVATVASVATGSDGSFLAAWIEADARMRETLDDRIEGEGAATGPFVARALSAVGYDRLVVASSMPVRDVDAHTIHDGPVFANRGASGIDGFMSTALGAASVGGRTLALSGDLSMLHDAGGLLAEGDENVVFAVVDNGGGGLFDLLPTADHAPGFERLFVTPHGIDLDAVAAAYRVDAVVVDGPSGLKDVLMRSLAAGGRRMVIIPVEREADLKIRRALDDVARVVSSALS